MISAYTGVPAEIVSGMQLPAFHTDLRSSDLQQVFDLAAKFGIVARQVDARTVLL
jgi:hypothetical protein